MAFLPRRYSRCIIYLFLTTFCTFIFIQLVIHVTSSLATIPDVNDAFFSPAAAAAGSGGLLQPDQAIPDGKIAWHHFDAQTYVNAKSLRPGEDAFARNKFNQKVSDSIAVNRDIADVRDPGCRSISYDHDLPSTSVIITFINEARSTLLRTVISVFKQTPAHLLKEIILVDDFSDDPTDGQELERIHKVTVLRNAKREGLIRSRVYGARLAVGDTLTFLDSHVECNKHWLEPLLQEVKRGHLKQFVVSPLIDIIDKTDFSYIAASPFSKGGFEWNLNFRWDTLSERDEKLRDSSPVKPIRTPVIAGGLFTIGRQHFFDLGAYDLGMNVWGGENIEFSFRVWMCHSVLEIVPCSRVGHVFRDSHPYDFPGGSATVFARNNRRVAEVWMDDYKEIFYSQSPYAKTIPEGDIDDRLELKKRLGCHPFQWYLKEVYPEKEVPGNFGRTVVSLAQNNNCMDTMGHYAGQTVGLYPCHNVPKGNQEFYWSLHDQLAHNDLCLEPVSVAPRATVLLRECKKQTEAASQRWTPLVGGTGLVRLTDTDYCLDSKIASSSQGIVIERCDAAVVTQRWTSKVQT